VRGKECGREGGREGGEKGEKEIKRLSSNAGLSAGGRDVWRDMCEGGRDGVRQRGFEE